MHRVHLGVLCALFSDPTETTSFLMLRADRYQRTYDAADARSALSPGIEPGSTGQNHRAALLLARPPAGPTQDVPISYAANRHRDAQGNKRVGRPDKAA
jgi:hypothetical protein